MANTVRVAASVTGVSKSSSELDKLRDRFEKLQKQGAKGLMIGAGVALTNLAFQAVGMAVSNLTRLMGDSVAAFREDQASVVQLGAALRANIPNWNGNTDAIERTLKARMDLGFADEVQRASLGKLVAAYGDVNKALETERLAMDLARFSGMDLAGASDLLIKVHAGSYRALKSLGISTKDVKNETQALGLIYDKVKGQAVAYAGTSAGKIEAANVRIGESMEKAGEVLDKIWGQGNIVLAEFLDSSFRRQQEYHRSVEELASKSNDELAAIAQAGAWKQRDIQKAALAEAMIRARGESPMSKQVTAMYDVLEANRARIVEAAAKTGTGISDEFEETRQESVDAIAGAMDGMANALRGGRDKVLTAATSLGEALTTPMTYAARLAELQGVLAGSNLAAGLRSTDPVIRAEAQALKAAVEAEISRLVGAASTYGLNWGIGFSQGLKWSVPAVESAAQQISRVVNRYLRVMSPAKEGPFSEGGGPEGWGRRFGDLYGKGLQSGLPDVGAMLSGRAPMSGTSNGGGSFAGSATGFGNATVILTLNGRELGRALLEEADFRRGRGTFLPA